MPPLGVIPYLLFNTLHLSLELLWSQLSHGMQLVDPEDGQGGMDLVSIMKLIFPEGSG